ncbi:hypothetical protein L3Y34_016343 [Caenorhabditis briggsae]|uniref:Uncharacterized protein n=1 Tax=Caenorhabditis briggsae TaxID=6238 RepID=A0AAE9J0D4_CAEBR|nr:hypothetical protein L3Y34_016343 [Caenorhabditis briggsae]
MVDVRFPPGLSLLIILPIFMVNTIQTVTGTLKRAENASDSGAVEPSTPTHSVPSNIDSKSPSSETPAPSAPSSSTAILAFNARSDSIAPGDVIEILTDQKNRDDLDILKLCHFNSSQDVQREMMRYKKHFISFHPTAAMNQGAERRDASVKKCLEDRDKSIEEFCGTPACEWALYWTSE